MLEVCILAAGVGSRMKSDKPKVLQTIAGKTFLDHLLSTTEALSADRIHVVIGQGAEQVKQAFAHRADINWVHQGERLGTGHAMQQVGPHLNAGSKVLILLGDAPLLKIETLRQLADHAADLTILSVDMADPFNYGRIVRNGEQVLQIVEEKDASDEQRSIKEINSGVMACDAGALCRWLEKLTNDNAQKEYLLTDIVAHANAEDAAVAAVKAIESTEVTGVNTFAQLAGLERALQKNQAEELMNAGVQVMDPARLDIRGNLLAGRGVKIDVNVIFEGDVTLGDDVTIGPNCVIIDSTIEKGAVIKANSMIEGAVMAPGSSAGPFARLRPGAVLGEQAAVGNFVEVKKTTLGKGTKASHLTYLGDATLGDGVNVGAGTITCNYDGVNKWQTEIGDGAFIGSNSSLVAPVTIGAGATVGAGSTITKTVADDDLALGRGKQRAISNWQRPQKDDSKED